MMNEFKKYLEVLKKFSYQQEFSVERERALQTYYSTFGMVNEEDFFFENRIELFYHFFIFEYRLSDNHKSQTLFDKFMEKVSENDSLKDYYHFRNRKFSLYEIKKVKKSGKVYLYDLSNQSFVEAHLFEQIGDLVQGRLLLAYAFCFKGEYFISSGFPIISSQLKSFVLKYLKDLLPHHRPFESIEIDSEFLSSQTKLSHQIMRKHTLGKVLKNRHQSQIHLSLSPFESHTPLYDSQSLLELIAYCSILSYRYIHRDICELLVDRLART